MSTGRSGFETVVVKRCPFRERERAVGFSKVKSTAWVNKVHRLTVGMGSYGVSEVSTRAGE